MRALEDETEPPQTQGCEILLRHRRDVVAGYAHASAGGPVHAGEDVEKGGLAGARRPHDRDELPGLHGQVDAAQHPVPDSGPAGVVLGHGCGLQY